MPVIKASNLTRRFGAVLAVDHLSFEVEEGEVFGLLGPNGAGKTTTLRMLACLISPTEGTAEVGGYSIHKDPNKIRSIIGFLTENLSLYERLTAYENLEFFAEAYGVSDKNERRNRIRKLLEFFDLWSYRDKKVATFSRGMKQKLAIARALVNDPPILFLDEPTANLDPETSKEIRDMINELSREKKRTILLSTHRLEDAERLCRRVMIIKEGRKIALGSPEELRRKIDGLSIIQIHLKNLDEKIVAVVKSLGTVKNVKVNGDKLLVTVEDPDSSTPEIVRRIVYAGRPILSVSTIQPSLENVYLKLISGDANED